MRLARVCRRDPQIESASGAAVKELDLGGSSKDEPDAPNLSMPSDSSPVSTMRRKPSDRSCTLGHQLADSIQRGEETPDLPAKLPPADVCPRVVFPSSAEKRAPKAVVTRDGQSAD